MSRHKKAYTDDDFDDYYDDYDDDYYEEEYDDYQQTTAQAPSTSLFDGLFEQEQEVSSGSALEGGNEDAQKILDVLGAETTVTYEDVVMMLEAQNNSVERTIEYFLTSCTVTEPEKKNKKEVAASKPVKGSFKQVSLSGNKKTPVKDKGDTKEDTKEDIKEDVKEDAKNVKSILTTENAPLSDDDIDTDEASDKKVGKEHITMVVAGHVDAGKSTLVGNLLYHTGYVNQRQIHKYNKESEEIGKASFGLAWVMDENKSEREHGVTIDIAEKRMETDSKIVNIIDAPGHKDFIPNMINGATMADCALLVVPASMGDYENSISDGAQTREHAILLKALGVHQVLVVVNKMDKTPSMPWNEGRYQEVVHALTRMLVELQFQERNLRFVPTSGYYGHNLIQSLSTQLQAEAESGKEGKLSEEYTGWYEGLSVLESIDTFRAPNRFLNKAVRAIVTSVVAEKDKNVLVRVNVVQGKLKVNRGVSLTTSKGAATITKMMSEEDGTLLDTIEAGGIGTITLTDRSGRTGEEMNLRNGQVLSKGPPLVTIKRKCKATILTLNNISPPILPGSTFQMYIHGIEVLCRVDKIHTLSYVRSDTGEMVVKNKPKCIPGSRSAVISIIFEKSIAFEAFSACKALGRFAMRAVGGTVAVGVIN